MNKKEMLGALALAVFIFWLINHWFYWLIVGLVLTIIVSDNIDPHQKEGRIQLTGWETVFTSILAGLVLYGIDRLFGSVFA